MAQRSIQGYVELASGLGEMTRSRATEAAKELVHLAGIEGSSKKVAKQASRLADDLLRAAETNRQQLLALVRSEVESALGMVDMSRVMGEVQALRASVTALAAQMDEMARSAGARAAGAASSSADTLPEPARVAVRTAPAASPSPTKKAVAKKAPAEKSVAKKAPAKKAVVKKAVVKKAPAKKAVAKKAVAKKAPAEKAPAKKAPAKKAPAKKAAAGSSDGSTG
ncbi:MAG: hypothetical protein ABIQ61_04030 [Ornithinibacter sp.]